MEQMTDRELLEFAAKAAGIEIVQWQDDCPRVMIGFPIPWNPLANDGDALRLAERCSLTVCMNGSGTVSACDDYMISEVFAKQSIHECGGSRIAATRRAIVRAAASIGLQEKPQ